MTSISATNASSSTYSSSTSTSESSDLLEMDSFLTMLVAQLENQDPLNPMEGTDFTSQLAQFSALEAQQNTNDKLDAIAELLTEGAESDYTDYIGKQIVGEVDTIDVIDGETTGGYFTLESEADVVVGIYDESGQLVRTLYPGSLSPGSYEVGWNGIGSDGETVEDGTYTYQVIAKDANGNYSLVDTTVIGTVDGLVNNNGTTYLSVNGALIDPDNVIEMSESAQNTTSPIDFLGETVEADTSVMAVSGGTVTCDGYYSLDGASDVAVVIYDAFGNAVKTIDCGNQESGSHSFEWNGTTDSGGTAPDGIYTYEVVAEDATATTTINGDVSGVVYHEGSAYLNIGDWLIDPSSVTKVGGSLDG